jgi:hypothetical protein
LVSNHSGQPAYISVSQKKGIKIKKDACISV